MYSMCNWSLARYGMPNNNTVLKQRLDNEINKDLAEVKS